MDSYSKSVIEVTESSMVEERQNQLFQAAFTGNTLLLQDLLRDDPLLLDRASFTADESAVHVASLRGHAEFVASALSHSPRLATESNSRGLTPLHVAAGAGYKDVVREILRRVSGDDVVSARSKDGKIPLHLAVEKSRVEVIAELIRACPSSTRMRLARGETVLHLCVVCDYLEGMKLIAEMDGGDVLLAERDDDDNTVLHLAAIYKQFETIKYLVGKPNIDVNAQNKNGFTTLDLIYNSPRDFHSLQILTFLLESGFKRSEPRSAYPSIRPNTDMAHRAPRDKCWKWKRLFLYTPAYTAELDGLRGSLIITAALLAGPNFQVGVSPPQDKSDMAVVWSFASISLTCSLFAIVLLISGVPLRKNGLYAWIIVSLFLMSIVFMMIGFLSSTVSNENRYSGGIDVMIYVILGFSLLVCVVGFAHLIRVVVWIWMKVVKCGRKRRPENIA